VRRLGRFLIRRRWYVLAGALVFLLLAGAFGGSVEERLSTGGFNEDSAESSRAEALLEERFRTGSPNVLLLVETREGSVDDPEVADLGQRLTDRLAEESAITEAFSYWSLGGAPPLRGRDGRSALVLGRIPGNEDEVRDGIEGMVERYEVEEGPITVGMGGAAEVFRAISEQAKSDLQKAEALSLPATLVLLLIVFGGVIAAGLPLAVAALAVVGTLLVLRLFTAVTEVSIFALNLTTAMGLGLAIDYSLFIVPRYREELRGGRDMESALLRTMQTAGRTIAFSALTVAVSLASLLVFPMAYLRSFAYAGTGVVALAGVGAVIVLPALLAVLGPRIDRFSLRHRPPTPVGQGLWHRVAVAVMRRPVPVTVVVVALLLLLGTPFRHIELGLPDDRVLNEDAPVRQVNDELRRLFPNNEAGALPVVAEGRVEIEASADEITDYATRLSEVDGVARVDAVTGFFADGAQQAPPIELSERHGNDEGTWFSVVPGVEPLSAEGEELVADLREVPAPFDVLVGGSSAELVDAKETLFARLPIALVIIAVLTFVLLFLMVGSLLVPAKALVLNLLSLSATFGAMVWVFQDGHLSGLLDFTPTGVIDVFTPILMFCVAFGLSMDYEVFLLSRIKEEYDIERDNEHAVAVGLERTGRIVTAAALLLALVFVAFATSAVSVVKLIGLGLALAVLVDAFIIRATLVPALMRLAGRANWWAPPRLRRLHLRYGIYEDEPLAVLDLPGAERPRHIGTR
jgi:putative drug exporter of the RND superfamily